MKKFIKSLFFLGYFISVFVFWPRAAVPFEIPKVIFVQRWIEFLFGASVIYLIIDKKIKPVGNTISILVAAFWMWAWISSFVGTDILRSITGNYYRGDGLITLTHMLTLFYVVGLFFKKDWIRPFLKCIFLTSVILGFISILIAFVNAFWSGWLPTWEGGIGSTFGNPNFLAGYLLISLPIGTFFVDEKKDIFPWVFLAVQMMGILLTRAWVGYFGTIIFLIVWLFFKLKNLKYVLLTLGLAILAFTGIRFYKMTEKLTSVSQVVADSRQRIFVKGFLAWEKRPITGYGWANFDRAFESVDWPMHLNNDIYVDKAHSTFVEVLVTTGFVGFVIYLTLILKTILEFIKKRDKFSKYLLGVLVMAILHMQTNVTSISEDVVFWILLGIAAKNQ